MSLNRVPDAVIDRLRTNLRTAEIQAVEADIQGIVDKGFLSRLADIQRMTAQPPVDAVRHCLAAWAAPPTQAFERPAALRPHASPIAAVAAQLRARQISPVELVEQALERIAERDPELNAFQLVLAEQARAA